VERRAEGGLLADAWRLRAEELTAYLEREGVKLAKYEQWRPALDEGGAASAATTSAFAGLSASSPARRGRWRKQRRCSFSKKVETLHGEDEGDDTSRENEK
jgi:hypothetical protein